MSTAASAAGDTAVGANSTAAAGPEVEIAAGAAEADKDMSTLGVAAVGPPGATSLLKQIENLKQQQALGRAARQRIARELRNAQRRKRRLKARARQLSNDDLVTVLLMRSDAGEPAAGVGNAPATPEPLAGSSPAKKAKAD